MYRALAFLMTVAVVGGVGAERAEARFKKWATKAKFNAVVVKGHNFYSAELTRINKCALKLRLNFSAPNRKPYWHEFKATVFFSNGRTFKTFQFKNAWHGPRRYHEQEVYTRKQGCWASNVTKITRLAVTGCQGRGCVPGSKGGKVKRGKTLCEYRMRCSYKVKWGKRRIPDCVTWVTAWNDGVRVCGPAWPKAKAKAAAKCRKRKGKPVKFCNVRSSKVKKIKR